MVSLDLKSTKDKSGPSFSFTGAPCSLASSVEEVLKDGNCLLLTDPAVANITGGRVSCVLVSVSIVIVKP